MGGQRQRFEIIGLRGFFPHFALSWLADWVPVWRGLVIKDGICSRRVPQSNANFCSLSPQTHPPTPPPRPPAFLSLMLKEIFIVSHISYSLCSPALTTLSCVCERECVQVSVCYPCLCGFHMHEKRCEDATGLYVAVCTVCVCAHCCKVAYHPPTPFISLLF